MSAHKEMTRYAFISHMEAYMKKLLQDPLTANVDDFLKEHGINGQKALEILLKRANKDDKNSAILLRTTSIKDNGRDKDGKRLKDSFIVKYSLPRKDYNKKMRNLYINLFESNIIEGCPINEDGEGGDCACADGNGGATNADSSGQFIGNGGLIKKKMPKTVIINEEQLNAIKEEVVCDTPIGDFGYDANALSIKKNDPSMNHSNMFKKDFEEKND